MMNNLKPTNKRNVYLAFAVIALSAFGIGHTIFGGGWSKNTGEAAKMYPRLIYGILIAVAVYLLIVELLKKTKLEPPAIAIVKWWQVPLVLVVTIAFFYFVLYAGVAVGILLFLFGMIWLFDEDPKKNWKMNLIVAVCATVGLWVIFTKVLPVVTMKQILF